MKQLLFVFAFLPVVLYVSAQATEDKYTTAMQQKIKMLDTARSIPVINNIFYDFKRIAEMEKAKWLPYYYMSYIKLKLAMAGSRDQADAVLDEAKDYCSIADSLNKNNAELLVLKSRIALAQIPINMMERGPKYSALAKIYAESAVKTDTKNPRAYIALGMYYLYTPSAFGGDKSKACENFAIADNLFKGQPVDNMSINPRWGGALLGTLIPQCQ